MQAGRIQPVGFNVHVAEFSSVSLSSEDRRANARNVSYTPDLTYEKHTTSTFVDQESTLRRANAPNVTYTSNPTGEKTYHINLC